MKENITINTHILINYAYGMLEPDLAQYIKEKIEQDTLLQHEYHGIVAMIKDYPNEDIEELLEHFSASAELNKPKASKTVQMKWFSIAASLLLVVGLGWWFYTNQQTQVNQFACLELTEILQKENKYIPQVRDISNDSSAWLDAFDQDKFSETIQILSKPSQQLKPVEQYYLALAYLYVNPPNYEASTQQFEAYLSSGALALQSKCHLYLGAIALKQNKMNEAKIQLSKVSNEDKHQADFLLREIK